MPSQHSQSPLLQRRTSCVGDAQDTVPRSAHLLFGVNSVVDLVADDNYMASPAADVVDDCKLFSKPHGVGHYTIY